MEYSRKLDKDQQEKQLRNSSSGSAYDKIESPIVSPTFFWEGGGGNKFTK